MPVSKHQLTESDSEKTNECEGKYYYTCRREESLHELMKLVNNILHKQMLFSNSCFGAGLVVNLKFSVMLF